MNRRQWLSVWELNSSQAFLEDKAPLVRGLPKVTLKPAAQLPLAVLSRPLRPAF